MLALQDTLVRRHAPSRSAVPRCDAPNSTAVLYRGTRSHVDDDTQDALRGQLHVVDAFRATHTVMAAGAAATESPSHTVRPLKSPSAAMPSKEGGAISPHKRRHISERSIGTQTVVEISTLLVRGEEAASELHAVRQQVSELEDEVIELRQTVTAHTSIASDH